MLSSPGLHVTDLDQRDKGKSPWHCARQFDCGLSDLEAYSESLRAFGTELLSWYVGFDRPFSQRVLEAVHNSPVADVVNSSGGFPGGV